MDDILDSKHVLFGYQNANWNINKNRYTTVDELGLSLISQDTSVFRSVTATGWCMWEVNLNRNLHNFAVNSLERKAITFGIHEKWSQSVGLYCQTFIGGKENWEPSYCFKNYKYINLNMYHYNIFISCKYSWNYLYFLRVKPSWL